jgi:Fic family protein
MPYTAIRLGLRHPVDQISYAHYALVAVHPFTNGNGRVAQAFSSVFSYRHYSVPLLITADQKVGYFDALSEADRGEFGAFRRFIDSRVTQAIRLMVTSM